MTAALGFVLYAVIVATNLYFRWETLGFLAKHPAIVDAEGLEAFKSLARRNMKAVFPMGALFLVAMGFSGFLVLHHPLVGFVAFLLANGLVVWSALALIRVERRARAVPCGDATLAADHERVSTSWLSKAWPDF